MESNDAAGGNEELHIREYGYKKKNFRMEEDGHERYGRTRYNRELGVGVQSPDDVSPKQPEDELVASAEAGGIASPPDDNVKTPENEEVPLNPEGAEADDAKEADGETGEPAASTEPAGDAGEAGSTPAAGEATANEEQANDSGNKLPDGTGAGAGDQNNVDTGTDPVTDTGGAANES